MPRKTNYSYNSAHLIVPTPSERAEFEENLSLSYVEEKSGCSGCNTEKLPQCYNTGLPGSSGLEIRICPRCEQLWRDDKERNTATVPQIGACRPWQAFTSTIDSIKRAVISKFIGAPVIRDCLMRYGLTEMLFPHVRRSICSEPVPMSANTVPNSGVSYSQSERESANDYCGNRDYPMVIPHRFSGSDEKYWQSDWMTITIRNEPQGKRQCLKRKAADELHSERPKVKWSRGMHSKNKRTGGKHSV